MSAAIPTVVIVGRPNVGKSTLFNRITGQRRAIVGDEPGITRDRIHGTAEHDGRRFELIDTGGIVVADQEYIPAQILRQADFALHKAAHIIFLIDGRAEITGSDRDLAQMLQRLGKPVSLAVNKIDTAGKLDLAHEFYELGIGNVFPSTASASTRSWITSPPDLLKTPTSSRPPKTDLPNPLPSESPLSVGPT
jgi:GTP-binding protein